MDIMWDVYIELMRRLQVVGYVSRILAVMDRGNRDETKASLGNNQTRGREPPGKSEIQRRARESLLSKGICIYRRYCINRR